MGGEASFVLGSLVTLADVGDAGVPWVMPWIEPERAFAALVPESGSDLRG